MAPKPPTHHHRSTLSQSNKSFKARYKTKGSLKQISKGRIEKSTNKNNQQHKSTKIQRKNQSKQILINKQKLLNQLNKPFLTGTPRTITILSLSSDINPYEDILIPIKNSLGLKIEEENQSSYQLQWLNNNSTYKFQFVLIQHGIDITKILSLITLSDFLFPILSSQQNCSEWGEKTLRSIQSIGGPLIGTIGIVKSSNHNETKDFNRIKSSLLSFLTYFFPETLLLNRICSINSNDEIEAIMRLMIEKKTKSVINSWRDGRGRLLSDKIEYNENDRILKVTGYIRGGTFSCNRLIHIPFYGDYKLLKITKANDDNEERDEIICERDDEIADDLISINCPSTVDQMMNEQTWPTEEEINSAPANQIQKKKKRRVPIGTSEYQAAWIPEGQEYEEVAEEEMIDIDNESDQEIQPSKFIDLEQDIENLQLEEYRSNKLKQRLDLNKEDEEFPDEIDTPLNILAKQRFARYRGLKNLRKSYWDPFENLPLEYGKIFNFKDWKIMGRKLIQKANEDQFSVGSGMKVTLHIQDFTKQLHETIPKTIPITIYTLYEHEHKYTVMNFTTQRNTEYDSVIKSKQELIICIGFRYYKINPIWSQPTIKSSNNVHKFERYLRHGKLNIGTAYLPVTFGSNIPIILFQQTENMQLELVGNGTLIGSEPSRIICKRIILSGHPYKVHKKTATIRYMFFNRDDIEYFKPIELRTKKGRLGHIKEALGTHGYFKASFDGPIDQMDTICMALYKRCFPKWATAWNGLNDDNEKLMELDQ
ncbi:hypothetical protein CROQUDRAFT_65959 [Cronartium quercuum f. sp. fusiforme G11]|uniref:Uncharacterized protein n=1 Tax=Cronartium quercuum f. sp. fusiforme G11 TaxID=708437 RepID=A0A9P6NCN9_9BASI|nr:hypothetical protein CROQUDRAFT_65959 [Cronartium quercuum f. sp. fusiforme G11]